MKVAPLIAKHFRDVYFAGNWTCSNLMDQLADVTFEEANTQVYGLNTIGTLQFHIHYYVDAQLKVLKGGPLEAKDKFSFDHPPISSQAQWDEIKQNAKVQGEEYAQLIEQLENEKIGESFVDEKYGSYYRNLNGLIEHTHYHLGQIAILKKIIRAK